MVRLFLSLVGVLYLALSIWCSFDARTTSAKVGFDLQGDTGRSEFLTVYGGLEFGLGLLFLLPWFWPTSEGVILGACFLIHASLVVFRSASLFLYPEVARMTWNLAAGEWAIAILSLLLLLTRKPS